jgi:hypothetical protein
MFRKIVGIIAGAMILMVCSKPPVQVTELKHFPMDNLDGLITLSGTEIDKTVSSDNGGSLKITSSEPVTVNLYEVNNPDIEDARLVYQAKVRCENLTGQAYLEMWCHFPGMGDFFSRGLQTPLSGTMNWMSAETPFFLKKGQRPDIVKLNIVVNGSGIVWIDDIHLIKAPL